MRKDKLNQRLRSRAELDKSLLDHGWHSGAYRRHFEGYTELQTIDEKGKKHIQRVYTGDLYRQDIPDGKRAALRAVYVLLFLVMAALFVLCATREVSANSTWYVALSQFGVLVGLGWVLAGLIAGLAAHREMTVGEWKSSSVRLRRGTICAALTLELTAFLTLLNLFFRGDRMGVQLLGILGYFLAGGVAVVMNRLEANLPYKITPSAAQAPEGGTEINV